MVIIVVPIYKEQLTELELISFKQLINLLSKYDICIVAPENLKIPREVNDSNLCIQHFGKSYFDSIQSYNKLMLTPAFYERFIDYDYMLIYQLDAFVFSDNLQYFCDLGYDYIGAPWLMGTLGKGTNDIKICWVGNGGFSLRKIDSTIKLLRDNKDIVDNYDGNEDVFFAASNEAGYRTAPIDIALSFSFEMEVRKCFELNHKQIPFGCHAWPKFDLLFWKPYLESFGYKICDKFLLNGNMDEIYKLEYQRDECFSELFNDADRHADFRKSLYNVANSKKKYIWGSGFCGMRFYNLFKKCDINIYGFIDSDVLKQGGFIDEHQIYDFGSIEKHESFIIICIRNNDEEIIKKLEEAGWVYKANFVLLKDIERLFIQDHRVS